MNKFLDYLDLKTCCKARTPFKPISAVGKIMPTIRKKNEKPVEDLERGYSIIRQILESPLENDCIEWKDTYEKKFFWEPTSSKGATQVCRRTVKKTAGVEDERRG